MIQLRGSNIKSTRLTWRVEGGPEDQEGSNGRGWWQHKVGLDVSILVAIAASPLSHIQRNAGNAQSKCA